MNLSLFVQMLKANLFLNAIRKVGLSSNLIANSILNYFHSINLLGII